MHSEPARPASVASDVVVPGLQAAITGAVAAAVAGAAAWALGWPAWVAAFAGLAVLAVSWVLLLLDHRRLLWAVENVTRADLDGDGETGRPLAAPSKLVLEVIQNGERRGIDFLQLDIEEGAFLQWAAAAIAGRSLAVSGWVGRGRPFTRGQYDGMLAELERAGIVRLADPRNPQNGRELSPAGRAALRACMRERGAGTLSTAAYAPGGGGGER